MKRALALILALLWLVGPAAAGLSISNLTGFNVVPAASGAPASLAIAATSTYSDATGSVTTHPVTLPTGITSGDLLLTFFAGNGSLSITGPSGWTQLLDKTNTDRYVIWGKIADGSEGSTANYSRASGLNAVAVSYRITGARNGLTTSEIAISTAVDESSATPDPPSLTPSWGSSENLWIALTFSKDGGYTFSSYPTNYSLGQNNVQVSTSNGSGISVGARLFTATSEDPGVFTTVTARNRSTYTLAVRGP